MQKNNITYERSINKSYMKIPAEKGVGLDEKLIFHKPYRGILPVEKCYVNGVVEYWYQITGKQALDTYCKFNTIGQEFFEMLILRICSQLEILEWNLIDAGCLVLDPELIFMNHNGEDILFVLYPESNGNFFEDFQKLMEYILTKINHEDRDAIKQPYKIYEMSLSEAFRIEDVKKVLLENAPKEEQIVISEPQLLSCPMLDEENEEDFLRKIEKRCWEFLKQITTIFSNNRNRKEDIPMVVYPDEAMEEDSISSINPTICLMSSQQGAKGLLLYEGIGEYPDFELEEGEYILGKNISVNLRLDKETISQYHAKFECLNKTYYIEDLNSTNGTYVNDELLNYKEKKELSPGDLIRFADVKYRFL